MQTLLARTVRTLGLGAGLAAALATLAGCVGSGRSPAGPAESLAPLTAAESLAPLTAAESLAPLTAAETSLLYQAEHTLTRDCMRRQGFDYAIPPEGRVEDDRVFPYVIDDVGWARAHGYGSDVEARIAQARETDPNHRYLQALPADRRGQALATLNGGLPHTLRVVLPGGAVITGSERGCTAEAERALYQDLPAWFRTETISQNIQREWRTRVTRDARFAAAAARWTDCMRRLGHPYPNPDQARRAARGAGDRAGEIRIAVAEATCAGRSGLGAVIRELDREYEAAARLEYRTVLAELLRLQRAALPRAAAVVANG